MIALLLAATLALPAHSAVKNPDVLVYAEGSDYDSLDPAWCFEAAGHAVISNVYDYLLEYRPGGATLADLKPSISEAVPTRANGLLSADGLVYRFPIRKGVKFHDGRELTAEDARYSLLRFMLLDRAAGPSVMLLQPILGVDTTRPGGTLAADAYARAAAAVTVEGSTLVVRLNRPFTPFLSILAGNAALTSKAWARAHGQWDGEEGTWTRFNNPAVQTTIVDGDGGSGPFAIVRRDREQRQVLLARHENYWRGPAPLKRVVIKAVPEFSTRKLMLQAGDADAINVTLAQRSQVENMPGVELIDVPLALSPVALYFVLDISTEANSYIGSGKLDGQGIPADFFTDREVRLGFAHSIDHATYVREVLRGRGAVPSGFMPAVLGATRAGPGNTYDPAAAAVHFKKAWGGKLWREGFRMTLSYVESADTTLAVFQMLKRSVESLNPRFQIEIRAVQNSTSADQARRRKMPIIVGAWRADYPDPHAVAFPLMHSGGYYPAQQRWKNAEVDALIEKAASESDPAKRAAAYARVQAIADAEAPNAPFAQLPRFRTQRTWLKGYIPRPDFPSPMTGYFYDLRKVEE